MADYCLRIYRRFPHKRLRQVVIYLAETSSELVYQQEFIAGGMHHRYEVIRLWEQPSQVFFEYPGLLPFAVLGQTQNRIEILRQVALAVDGIADRQTQRDVAASTAVLAGLVLEKSVIQRILRREIMRESVIYHEWRAEALAEGRAEGRREGEAALVLRLLTRRVGPMPEERRNQVLQLSVEQLEALGEALLDFSTLAELEAWLDAHQQATSND